MAKEIQFSIQKSNKADAEKFIIEVGREIDCVVNDIQYQKWPQVFQTDATEHLV